MNFIVIDCGASFIKGAFIQNGKIIRKVQHQSPAGHQLNNLLNPLQVQALIPLVKQMILKLADTEKEIKLCISNEMHGFLLAYRDGTPFTDYISWQHEYGTLNVNQCTAMQVLQQDSLHEEILFTGMPLRAGLPSCNLLYLYLNRILEKADGKLYFYTLGDYVLKEISRQEPMCHITNAAATGMYDLHHNNWNSKLIQIVGGECIEFPQIGIKELHFHIENVKITALPALGDQQASLLGAGLNNDCTLSFNLGTGSQVSKLVKHPMYSKEYQIRPYFYGYYLKTIPHLPCGRALNVFIRFFKDIFDQFQIPIEEDLIWKILLHAEQHQTDTKLSCDLSFFENSLTDHTVGNITNIGEYSLTVGSLMNAIFKQMSKNFIEAATIIEPDLSKIETIIFSGGIAHKIQSLRKHIRNTYPEHIKDKNSYDDTLLGLYEYGKNKL